MSASFSAAPVFSRMEPISAPRMITMPILLKVPEKPAPMTVGMPEMVVPSTFFTSVIGIPAISANTTDTAMMARNGWTLNLEMATIMTTIVRTKAMISGIPVITIPPVIKLSILVKRYYGNIVSSHLFYNILMDDRYVF